MSFSGLSSFYFLCHLHSQNVSAPWQPKSNMPGCQMQWWMMHQNRSQYSGLSWVPAVAQSWLHSSNSTWYLILNTCSSQWQRAVLEQVFTPFSWNTHHKPKSLETTKLLLYLKSTGQKRVTSNNIIITSLSNYWYIKIQ